MKFSHYSPRKDPINYYAVPQPAVQDGMKPHGLWISVDGEDDWASWCYGESFRPQNLRHRHSVVIRPTARILLLDTPEATVRFTEQFSAAVAAPYRTYIDWRSVARSFDGIVIAPYHFSLRMNENVFWYYPWDCASGCLWGAEAVESITYEGETGLPERIAEKEEEYARQRDGGTNEQEEAHSSTTEVEC